MVLFKNVMDKITKIVCTLSLCLNDIIWVFIFFIFVISFFFLQNYCEKLFLIIFIVGYRSPVSWPELGPHRKIKWNQVSITLWPGFRIRVGFTRIPPSRKNQIWIRQILEIESEYGSNHIFKAGFGFNKFLETVPE